VDILIPGFNFHQMNDDKNPAHFKLWTNQPGFHLLLDTQWSYLGVFKLAQIGEH
jgi:hypothetical protein